MGVPRYSAALLAAMSDPFAIALWLIERHAKKEEQALRVAKSDDPRMVKIVFLSAVLMISNACLIRFLH